jgi:hypothetical protein
MRRKNTKRFDPRYFMDEKTDKALEPSEEQPMRAPVETWDEGAQKCVELNETRDWAMEPHAERGTPDSAENVAAGECWHETKHMPEEEFAAVFNKCMQNKLSAGQQIEPEGAQHEPHDHPASAKYR